MRAIQLKPVEREAPVCERFDDEPSVRAYERAVRVHRAHTEPFRLERGEDRVDCTWTVTGSSGKGYRVDLVDGALLDTCECPDFLGGELGTCKHIEAARRAILNRPALRRALHSLDFSRPAPVLGVAPTERGALVPYGRWTTALLRRHGLESEPRTGGVRVIDPERVEGGRRLGARVCFAAARMAREHYERERLSRRRSEVEAAVDSGKLGLEVLSAPLFPYQALGVRRLVSAGRALLADDMGLGKTVQAIAACEVLRLRGEASRVLVVTQSSLKDQWCREINRYAGVKAVVVGGGVTERRLALASDAPYKVLNYELTWRELIDLQRLDADVLILDEAQRAKNFRTRTAATLRAIPARYVFALTGTPVENRLDDLYALLQLVDPSLLGPLWRFNLDYHSQDKRGRVTGYKNLTRLREVIAPAVLRRRKEEVLLQLPPVTAQTRYITLSPEQAQIEAGLRQEIAQLMAIAERRPLTPEQHLRLMMLLTKARQACDAAELCDPGRKVKASPKLEEFEALVGEIVEQGSSKVLVFSEWIGMLELAAKRLRRHKIGYELLTGSIPTDKRPSLLQRFREDPKVRVLLSTDAGGTGLNLQEASYVIHLDLPWNPARLDQRTARAHRMGQTRGVSVTYLCAATGIERAIEGILAYKRRVGKGALDVDSGVDSIEAPGSSGFMTQLRDAMAESARVDEAERAEEAEVAEEAAAPEIEGGTVRAALEAANAMDAAEVVAEETVELPTEETAEAAAEVTTAEPSAEDSVVDAATEVTVVEVATEAMATEAMATEAVATEAVATEAVATEEAPATGAGTDRDREGAPGAVGVPTEAPRRATGRTRADNRLRLARVVLDAGFASDAVASAYEAMAAAVRGMLDEEAGAGHAALVGAVFRTLIPKGRLPMAAHSVLAQLHDLKALDAEGVELDAAIARDAVDEAERWVERIAPRG